MKTDWTMWHVACAVGLASAVVFVGFPQIDLIVARLFFYDSTGGFWFNYPGSWHVLRQFLWLAFIGVAVVGLVALVASAASKRRPFGWPFPNWVFLVSVLAIGPGLVANVIFKDHWGRARPFHLTEFGYDKLFTPALMRSDQCANNCSFIGGEAAAMFALFFALALLAAGTHRKRLIGLGLAAGALAGFIRMAQGGHFLSDIVFAGVFMALVARGMYWVVLERFAPVFADGGPAQAGLGAAALGTRNVAERAGHMAQAGARRGSVRLARGAKRAAAKWRARRAGYGDRSGEPRQLPPFREPAILPPAERTKTLSDPNQDPRP